MSSERATLYTGPAVSFSLPAKEIVSWWGDGHFSLLNSQAPSCLTFYIAIVVTADQNTHAYGYPSDMGQA